MWMASREQQAKQMLLDAGFTHIEIKYLPADLHDSYYIATKE